MKILLLTDKLMTGGAENYFCRLENELKHPSMDFYAAAGDGELYEQVIHKERFIRLDTNQHTKNILKIRKKVMELRIDVIHANSLRMVIYAIVVQKTISKTLKIVYTKHNVTILEKKFKSLFRWAINHYIHKVITVSEFERKMLSDIGINPSLVQTVYNGVDIKRFSFRKKPKPKHEPYKVGILARLSPEKNHGLFLDIAKLLEHKKDIQFYIAGDGPEQKKIERKIKEMNLQNQVTMLGEVKNPEQFIREMDVLLLTSYREVFPMVVLEAMAVGTPIISVDIGGVKEAIMTHKYGFLVPKHSAGQFAGKILLLKENEQLRSQIAEQARNRVQHFFTLEHMVQKTINEYLTLERKEGMNA